MISLGFNEVEAKVVFSYYFSNILGKFLLNIARKFHFPEGTDNKLLYVTCFSNIFSFYFINQV